VEITRKNSKLFLYILNKINYIRLAVKSTEWQ
jgi:hypothetical protein